MGKFIPVEPQSFEVQKWAKKLIRTDYAFKGDFKKLMKESGQFKRVIPLKVNMKITVGSVRIELERVERPGWAPLDESEKLSSVLTGQECEE